VEIVAHTFARHDLIAGDLSLNFVNTVTARDAPIPIDWLDSYDRLLGWAELAAAVSAADLKQLRELAIAAPRRASGALAHARKLREALHQVCSALVAGASIPARALKEVEACWRAALSRATLKRHGPRVQATLDAERSGLRLVADRLALHAVDLLRDFPAERARVCRGVQCGWLFVDTSKGGHRVWCDMATCGNAAKSRRHQERQRRRS
jgi:predicted RNA-binding Zn ribbon-like protein